MSEMRCVFCKIMSGELDGSFVYRDELVSAFMDIHPLTPGHLLVVPNRHAVDLYDVDEGTAARMMQVGRKLGLAMMRSDLGCRAFNFFLANGKEAGQTVFHCHLHVIPRYPDDGFGVVFPPGYGRVAAQTELKQQAALIHQALEM